MIAGDLTARHVGALVAFRASRDHRVTGRIMSVGHHDDGTTTVTVRADFGGTTSTLASETSVEVGWNNPPPEPSKAVKSSQQLRSGHAPGQPTTTERTTS